MPVQEVPDDQRTLPRDLAAVVVQELAIHLGVLVQQIAEHSGHRRLRVDQRIRSTHVWAREKRRRLKGEYSFKGRFAESCGERDPPVSTQPG